MTYPKDGSLHLKPFIYKLTENIVNKSLFINSSFLNPIQPGPFCRHSNLSRPVWKFWKYDQTMFSTVCFLNFQIRHFSQDYYTAYSYAVHMMQCQGACRQRGAYIHTPNTALSWQTSNDKEKQTLTLFFEYLDKMIIYLTSLKHF